MHNFELAPAQAAAGHDLPVRDTGPPPIRATSR